MKARLYLYNTSGYRGVTFHRKTQTQGKWQMTSRKRAGNWQASIPYRGRQIYLGLYETPEAAARAYDAKAVELFGQGAALNFPKESQQR